MTHAAQVAFAFFADVGCEEESHGRLNFGVAQRGDGSQKRGQSGSVIAASRAENAVAFFPGDGVGSGRKDRVEMRGEDDDRLAVRLAAGQFAERVPLLIEVHAAQSQLEKASGEPGSAGGLPEGWGGNGKQLELPEAHLGLVQMQPVKGAMHGEVGGEARDAVLGERRLGGHAGDHAGYSTESRKRPRAGAVWPAAPRSRAARMAGMAEGASRPEAASTKVPTRLRTMWCRKPEPVIR